MVALGVGGWEFYTGLVNVIVVGAGIVGCAVAYELASRGAAVRILDMREVGAGATRASAGVLCPHIEGHAPELLQLGVRSLAMYDQFIARVADDSRQRIEYRRAGTLEVALTEEDASRLYAQAERHRAADLDHRMLNPREARSFEPALSEAITAALFIPAHGYVGVQGLTRALAAAAAAHGAVVEHASTVERVVQRGARVEVTVARGGIEADAVVIAAGPWSSAIDVGAGRAPVKPIRGQLLHLAFPSPPVARVIWGADCYLVPWQDGSLLVGATAEDVGFDETATVAGVRDLLDGACELLPAAWSARFHEVRVGLRPATSDELPIIGRSSSMPGVFYATGHYRNGVLLAPLTARVVADLVLERTEAPELVLTRPARFRL
jgi:glycine oxidase